jgi:hypothetical protein
VLPPNIAAASSASNPPCSAGRGEVSSVIAASRASAGRARSAATAPAIGATVGFVSPTRCRRSRVLFAAPIRRAFPAARSGTVPAAGGSRASGNSRRGRPPAGSVSHDGLKRIGSGIQCAMRPPVQRHGAPRRAVSLRGSGYISNQGTPIASSATRYSTPKIVPRRR